MSLAQTFGHQLGLLAIPNLTPIVFVVDEEILVCASLELLIRSQGWQPETFASAEEFLARPRPGPELHDPCYFSSGHKRPRNAKADCPVAYGDADHRHFQLRRYADNGAKP